MKNILFLAILILLVSLPAASLAGTITGFEMGGHFYSQAGNPNPNPIAPASPNYWCTVACLHMLFDYWDGVGNVPGIFPGGLAGNFMPQEEIAIVINVNDVQGIHGAPGDLYSGGTGTYNGTLFGDDHRGAHFSFVSIAGPIGGGYTWQLAPPDQFGYTSINADWTGASGTLAQLKAFVDAELPLILHVNWNYKPIGIGPEVPYAPETIMGHSILLIGYHEIGDSVELEFHDPWYGPNMRYDETTFFNDVWPNPTGLRFLLFAAPWDRDITVNHPGSATVGDNFNVTVDATYTDALPPINGTGVTILPGSDLAYLSWHPSTGISLQPGQANPDSLGGTITVSGTSGSVVFGLKADAEDCYTFLAEAYAMVMDSAPSYVTYNDMIGGFVSSSAFTINPAPDDDTVDDDTVDDDTIDDDTVDDDTVDDDIIDDDTFDDDTVDDDVIDDDVIDDDVVDDDVIDDDLADDDVIDDDTGGVIDDDDVAGDDDDDTGGCGGCGV